MVSSLLPIHVSVAEWGEDLMSFKYIAYQIMSPSLALPPSLYLKCRKYDNTKLTNLYTINPETFISLKSL